MGVFPVTSQQLRIQILKKLKNGKVMEKSEMLDYLAKLNKLTMSQYSRKDPTSKRNSWDQRVKWELSWVRKRGFINTWHHIINERYPTKHSVLISFP